MPIRLPFACCGFLLLFRFPGALTAQPKVPRHIVLPVAIREVSGMVRTPEGPVWLLNDSHNAPELFRFDPVDGKLLETRLLPVPNRDWEDLTRDSAGYLYIGDFGNNRNARRDLCVFRYHPVTGALDSITFRYPDQDAYPPDDERAWNFNCEAMVVFHDTLHIFSKNVFKGNFVTKHYTLPTRPGQYMAVLRDSLVLKNRVVTGAALSPDGRTFAITSYIIGKKLGFIPYTKATAYFFTDFPDSHFLRGRRSARRLPKCLIARQFESIVWWDNTHWLVANEQHGPQRQAIWRISR